jgi:hypothetical protein
MTEEPEHSREHDPGAPPGGQPFSQGFKHAPIAARIPEKVRYGEFCTGTMILQSDNECVIDFLSTMAPPQQIVARVIMTPVTFAQMIKALQANIDRYQQQFGPLSPHERTAPAPPAPPRLEDLYDQLKLPDELLGGVFANVVMIRHTAEEFCLDFIANLYPRSVVTSRVFFAAGRVKPFLETMLSALRKHQQGAGGQPPE